MAAHMVWDHGVVGSSPTTRTIRIKRGAFILYSKEITEKCSEVLDLTIVNGMEEIEFGGFAKRLDTGEYDLIFTTPYSERLCRDRTVENIKLYHKGKYSLKSVIVKTRAVAIFTGAWSNTT
jgi:hypothetical protein